ncbi:probable UTP7 - U3 snoRNP protein [Cephalotrichum gorgonifer]|uniref:U three protein 7 n=1 Tax=Cephalotrichum gorgonifer TaxID=2041049 RepID=A0AAE8SZ76_9PEZI|nr:probable UTP7 - U3 snoRNP protein [Cephalotrichum gorgonifer]
MEDSTATVGGRKGKSGARENHSGAVVKRQARTDLVPRHERVRAQRLRAAESEYGRGSKLSTKNIKDKKLKRTLATLENKFNDAAVKAKDAEILHENTAGLLETEHELERTYRVRQDEITQSTGIETARKRFDLSLNEFGPYVFDYSRNGRELLLGGRKGHVATMDWREGTLGCELNLGETVRDVKWLHNNQYLAVAQKKYTYIYDRNGVELHCLRKLMDVSHMEFLPYHFLLATMSTSGWLKYQDVSTGDLVSEIRTGLGAPVSLAQNPWNAILHAGHQNGTVTLWSPNSAEPLVKLLAHKGPVRSLAVDRAGRYMVSTGQDLKMAVWDIRMFKEVSTYFTRQPGSSVAISDTGLTSVAWGTSTTIWKGLFSGEKVKDPYMTWGGEGKKIERVRWCPLEDVLGLGHDGGFSSVIVPGAGEPNFDALEVNPYENARQRQEGEVKALLNKLKPEMIALDPNFVGQLDLRSQRQREAEKDLDVKHDLAEELRHRMRGRNSAMKKVMRKQRKRNIIDEKKLRIEELWKEQKERNAQKQDEERQELGPALSRFVRKE